MNIKKLTNGLTLIAQPTLHQTIHLAAFVKAGTKHEAGYPGGIAHFTEHMLFKGTALFTAESMAEEMDAIGGEVNAYTTKEYTCYTIKTLERFEQRAIMLLHQMLCHALFPSEEIMREIQVIKEEIKMTEDDPEEHIYEVLQQRTLSEALARPILGTAESVEHIDTAQLQRFYNAFYQPSNVLIGYVGNQTAVVESAFSSWTSGKEVNSAQPPFEFHVRQETMHRAFEQAHLIYGCRAVSYHDELYDAFSLFSSMFGESMSCPLFRRLREELGLCYNVYSSLEAFETGGLFSIYVGCDADNIPAVEQEIKQLLMEFKMNLCNEQLERGKNFLIINALMNDDYDGSIMMRNVRHYMYYHEVPSIEQFEERINRISLEQLLQVIERLNDFALIKYMN